MTEMHGDDLRSKASRQSISFRARILVAMAFCALGWPLWGCAAKAPALSPSTFGARPAGALEVELRFDGAADLDLHVTDPLLETVYFGNSPSTRGDRLDRDVRCERASEGDERRETVRFEEPLEGVYRVGIDYVKACRRLGKTADYVVRVVGPGIELEHGGRIEPGHFDHKALEFDWPARERANGAVSD